MVGSTCAGIKMEMGAKLSHMLSVWGETIILLCVEDYMGL